MCNYVPFVCFIRSLATHRGHVKKIKFGPGKGNQKLAALYADGIDIWDLQKVIRIIIIRAVFK